MLGRLVSRCVARRAADFEIVGMRPARNFVGGCVVVFEEIMAAAFDAAAIAFFHDPFLLGSWVPPAARGVDGPTFGVVNEQSDERLW